MLESRNIQLDIAKGIGILFVVYCHSIEIFNNEFPFRFFYLFHMAFFFILSGYFFKEKYVLNLKNIKDFIYKRAKKLLIPYLTFNIVFCLLHNFFIDILFLPSNNSFFDMLDTKVMLTWTIDKYTNIDIIKHLVWISLLGYQEFFVGTTWFLKVLFFINSSYIIGCYIINKYFNENYSNIIKLMICLICLVIGYYFSLKEWTFYKIGTMLSCVILFHIGTLHKKLKDKIPKINMFITFMFSTFLLCIINLYNPKFFYISHNWYNNPFWFLSASISGYIWILQLAKIIHLNTILTKIFSYIGKYTISILCLHLLFFKVTILLQIILLNKPIQMLQAYETYHTSYSWGFIYTFISIMCCLLSSKIYRYFRSRNTIRIDE